MSNFCVGSSMDSEVVGHNSGQILEIKDHICSDMYSLSSTYLHTHHSLVYCKTYLAMVPTSSDQA